MLSFIFQQLFEKLFLLAKFVKACLGNLEDFSKRDCVKDEIGCGELPLYVGLMSLFSLKGNLMKKDGFFHNGFRWVNSEWDSGQKLKSLDEISW